jgi:hypothetical protein
MLDNKEFTALVVMESNDVHITLIMAKSNDANKQQKYLNYNKCRYMNSPFATDKIQNELQN